jgi:hypothetical protein
MRLTDLLELGLDLADRVVLDAFDLFKGVDDDTKRLRVNTGGRGDLVDLGILGLQ